jgi:hypothetical protein
LLVDYVSLLMVTSLSDSSLESRQFDVLMRLTVPEAAAPKGGRWTEMELRLGKWALEKDFFSEH